MGTTSSTQKHPGKSEVTFSRTGYSFSSQQSQPSRDRNPVCLGHGQPPSERQGLAQSHSEQMGTCSSNRDRYPLTPDSELRSQCKMFPRPSPRHRVFFGTGTKEDKFTHLLGSFVSKQCKFNGKAFQRLFKGPPRAAVQRGPGRERGRIRPQSTKEKETEKTRLSRPGS